MTPYETVFNRFKLKIESTTLADLDKVSQKEMLLELLKSALSLIELDSLKIKNNLSDVNDSLDGFVADLLNSEIEVIALYMVVAWYEPIVNSLEHTLMFYGSKDEKWTNQRDHCKQMKTIQESYRSQARKYFMHHSSRNNSYLSEASNGN